MASFCKPSVSNDVSDTKKRDLFPDEIFPSVVIQRIQIDIPFVWGNEIVSVEFFKSQVCMAVVLVTENITIDLAFHIKDKWKYKEETSKKNNRNYFSVHKFPPFCHSHPLLAPDPPLLNA